MRYTKTEAGQQTFKDRSIPLTPRQRSAFILFDGKRTLVEVLAATSGLGVSMADVDHLVDLGLLMAESDATLVPPTSPAPAVVASPAGGGATALASPQDRYKHAYPIATQLTASLGLRGFRLNLAVEAAAGYEQLEDLLPKIRAAVGAEKCQPLERALQGL